MFSPWLTGKLRGRCATSIVVVDLVYLISEEAGTIRTSSIFRHQSLQPLGNPPTYRCFNFHFLTYQSFKWKILKLFQVRLSCTGCGISFLKTQNGVSRQPSWPALLKWYCITELVFQVSLFSEPFQSSWQPQQKSNFKWKREAVFLKNCHITGQRIPSWGSASVVIFKRQPPVENKKLTKETRRNNWIAKGN